MREHRSDIDYAWGSAYTHADKARAGLMSHGGIGAEEGKA
jgi:hypothetical protein